jgi:hypothetical protein
MHVAHVMSLPRNRLGRAISGRRQYHSYREAHHQKVAKSIEKIGFEVPRTGRLPQYDIWSCSRLTWDIEHNVTTNSTEATPMSVVERQNSLNVLDDDDSASQTSFAASSMNTANLSGFHLCREKLERRNFSNARSV